MKLDTAKILMQIAWEIKSIDNKKCTEISEKLCEIGKMIGGWHNQIKNKTLLPK